MHRGTDQQLVVEWNSRGELCLRIKDRMDLGGCAGILGDNMYWKVEYLLMRFVKVSRWFTLSMVQVQIFLRERNRWTSLVLYSPRQAALCFLGNKTRNWPVESCWCWSWKSFNAILFFGDIGDSPAPNSSSFQNLRSRLSVERIEEWHTVTWWTGTW